MKSSAPLFSQARPLPAPAAAVGTCTLRLTVDAASITALRQLAMRVCGDGLEFMRIALCEGGLRIRAWLCVQRSFAALLGEAIVRQLPGARFSEASFPCAAQP
jgi:hypothetical protein